MSDANQRYDDAVALKNQGDLEAGIAALREILADHPEHVLTLSALAVYLQQLGHDDEAVEHAKTVTRLEPDDPFAFTQLSVIYQRCGKQAEAQDAMARARGLEDAGGGAFDA